MLIYTSICMDIIAKREPLHLDLNTKYRTKCITNAEQSVKFSQIKLHFSATFHVGLITVIVKDQQQGL
jgi:hypothetical protein